MSCNCSTPTPTQPAADTPLPEIVTLCAGPDGYPVALPTSCPAAAESAPGTGTTLDASWTDAAAADGILDGAVPLMRYGRKLVRFTGSGFLQFFSGRAKLVKAVALKVTNLWHEWWTPAGIGRTPLLGNPYPFPYLVIADANGNLHAIQGQQDAAAQRDSVQVWSFERKQWEVRDIADFPALQKGLTPQVSQIEVTGFAPIPISGSASDVRQLSALAGEGLFRLKAIPTIASSCDCPGCAAQSAVAYVTEFIADPATEGTFSLKCTLDEDGNKTFAWVAD